MYHVVKEAHSEVAYDMHDSLRSLTTRFTVLQNVIHSSNFPKIKENLSAALRR